MHYDYTRKTGVKYTSVVKYTLTHIMINIAHMRDLIHQNFQQIQTDTLNSRGLIIHIRINTLDIGV